MFVRPLRLKQRCLLYLSKLISLNLDVRNIKTNILLGLSSFYTTLNLINEHLLFKGYAYLNLACIVNNNFFF